MLGMLLLAGLAGGMLGAVSVGLWQRRNLQRQEPAGDDTPLRRNEAPRQEARRYFLLNETGNVLIATSLNPTGPLPEATLALFSEALAHLSAVFFAIAGAKDEQTGQPFSLYNYAVLKRALALRPVFIRVSSEEPADAIERSRTVQPVLFGARAEGGSSSESSVQERTNWMEARVKGSRDALGMNDSAGNMSQLRAIHAQMRAEAERLNTRRLRSMRVGVMGGESARAPPAPGLDETPDEVEVGHVTLYCECLMGVSLVSVKLAHAHFLDYLGAGTLKMEQDTYLFVSPNQLRKTLNEASTLPHVTLQ